MKNPQNNNTCQFSSQLRYDLVSKDWVVIAAGRGKRPDSFKQERKKRAIDQKDCIFCSIEKQSKPLLIFDNRKVCCGSNIPSSWTCVVIPNKYPAFCPSDTLETMTEGKYYQTIKAVGYCEVVVTRDHDRHIPLLDVARIKEIIDAYQFRYLDLKEKKFVKYISIFHNHGVEAGASQPHPHSQIITSPLIDVSLGIALTNSKRFYSKHKKCIYCEMNKWEKKQKSRIIYENSDFLVLCPFAPKSAFEVIISPQKHLPYFENITESQKISLAGAFKAALGKIYVGLNDPPYNFYLHTAPNDGKRHPYYHWHWTIFPKTGTPAGFEIGTKMEISTIEPEKAAEYLRQQSNI